MIAARSVSALFVALLACGGESAARPRARVAQKRSTPRHAPAAAPSASVAATASPNRVEVATRPQPQARSAKITFDRPGLAPVPLVRATVRGQPTWLILDTGAFTHALSAEVARRGSLSQRDAGDGVEDHAGKALPASRADASSVVVDGWGRLPAGDLLVVEHAEGNLAASAGIGGTIAPALLADGAAIIVDLDRAELRQGNEEDVTRALASHRHDLAASPTSCHGVVSVASSIDGIATRLFVNTGASSSDVFVGTSIGRALSARSKPSQRRYDSAAGETPVRVVTATKVSAGAWSTTVDLNLVAYDPDPTCAADGDLGVDALRSCVLVYGPAAGRFRARCGK